jgi:hypothetical protein
MQTTTSIHFRQLISFIFFFFISNQFAFATHAVGADLTYQCLGNNTYEISLRFYRDCSGTAAPTNPSISIVGDNGCSSVTSSLTLSQIAFQEVSQVCAGTQTTCSGGATQGTNEYLYRGQVILPSGCDSYTLSYQLSARNNAITNLVNPGNADIYVETIINTVLAPCNNSPQFNNLPVLYGCPNQSIQFNHGSFDADGDSLSYSLINPRQAGGANIPFASGLSPTTPLNLASGTTFQFNSANGQMSFTPQANAGQVAVISVLIEEYRNGQKIGSMIRDLQMIILNNCNSTAPTVGAITPSSGTVTNNIITYCGGPSLSINFSISDPDITDVLTATSDISSVISGATVSIVGTNPITVQLNIPTSGLPTGNYPFTITVSDGGCPIPNVQIIGYNLRVNNTPPNVSINASNSIICAGDPITLNATGATTYNWDNGVNNGISFNPNFSNTYTVIGTTNGCSDTTSINITVNPSPTVQISASSNSICIGDQLTLNVNGNATNYVWNNGVVGGTPFSPTVTTTYTVTGTGANGCTNSNQITIPVNALPNVTANATKTTICQGEQVTLSGGNAASYTWDNGVINQVAFSPSSSATYNVTGTDLNGCTNTSQISITYSNVPAPIASIASPTTQICQGNNTTLTGSVNTGIGESIMWYRNGNLINGATSPNYTVNQGGTYSNIVTNSSFCTAISNDITISTSTIPNAPSTIAGFTNLCFGEREDYSISAVSGATSYIWSISPSNAASISTGQGSRSVKVNSTNVDFQLSVVAVNDCGSSNPSSKNVDLNNGISCNDISFAASNTAICEGESIIFSNYTDPNTVIGLTPSWDFGAGASPASATGNGPHTVTYNTSGLKTVSLNYIDVFGNSFNSNTYTDYVNVTAAANCSGVGVITIGEQSNIEYYPNPTTDDLFINLENPMSGIVEIVSIQGITLNTIEITERQELQVSLRNYPAGIYYIVIKTEKSKYILKGIKID